MVVKITGSIAIIALFATICLHLIPEKDTYKTIENILSIIGGVCAVVCLVFSLKNRDRYVKN